MPEPFISTKLRPKNLSSTEQGPGSNADLTIMNPAYCKKLNISRVTACLCARADISGRVKSTSTFLFRNKSENW